MAQQLIPSVDQDGGVAAEIEVVGDLIVSVRLNEAIVGLLQNGLTQTQTPDFTC